MGDACLVTCCQYTKTLVKSTELWLLYSFPTIKGMLMIFFKINFFILSFLPKIIGQQMWPIDHKTFSAVLFIY